MIPIYVASPFSSTCADTEAHRAAEVQNLCAWLRRHTDYAPFSPIAHWDTIAIVYELPTDAESWWEYNKAWLRRSSMLCVLCIDGWQTSIGVRMEIEFAKHIGMQIIYATWNGEGYDIADSPQPTA